MAELRIDRDAAHRVVSRLLRESGQVSAADATALATTICGGLQTSGTPPNLAPVKGWSMISERMPASRTHEFVEFLKPLMEDANPRVAALIWHTVYTYGRPVPGTVAV